MLKPGEKMMEISLYVGCSVSCTYCPQFSLFLKSKNKRLSVENYKILIDKIPSSTIIGFIGMSEPLLHRDFESIVKYTYEKGHKLVCFTTLPEKYTNNIEVFLNSSYWFNRSVHIRDEFMSYKNISKDYLKHLNEFLKQLKNKSSENKDTVTVLTKNVDTKIVDLFNRNNVSDLVHYTEPFKRINTPIHYKSPLLPKKLSGKIKCKHDHHRIQHLLPDGDVVLCCMDVEKHHVLGNLYNMSYDELYSGEIYKNILKGFNDETVNSICRECVFAENI